jgi:hypothetical protein
MTDEEEFSFFSKNLFHFGQSEMVFDRPNTLKTFPGLFYLRQTWQTAAEAVHLFHS